jgi:predicted  nucleic acid-binding Zn-ribbon protein
VLIEKLLKDAITRYTVELENINTNIKVLEASKVPVKENLAAAKQELQKVCQHTKIHRVDGSYYHSGYDYVSEEHYTIVCDNCGKILESKCIRGNTFG